MALSARSAYLEYVGMLRVSVNQMMAFITIALNRSLLEVSGMRKVREAECIAGALAEFQRH